MEDQDNQKLRKRTKLFQHVVIGVNTLLRRWSSASNTSDKVLLQSDAVVEDVIRETESAVIKIGDSFHTILTKTRQQTALATGLLRRHGGDAANPHPDLGLQDYVSLYEKQVKMVTLQLGHYSTLAAGMVAHQKKVRENAAAMDDVLDELRSMSAQISKISLDASVAATNQDFDPATFIAMTDRVRAISEQSHDLTRRARQGLDSIREEVGAATKRTSQAAQLSREAADVAIEEVHKLNAGMLEKGSQIESTLRDINLLGGDIQVGIQEIIIAMQFQDLIQQKLEKLRNNNLSAVRESLAGLSHETRALMQRDLYRAILSYSESSIQIGDLPSSDDLQDTLSNEGTNTELSKEQSSGDDNRKRDNVELF